MLAGGAGLSRAVSLSSGMILGNYRIDTMKPPVVSRLSVLIPGASLARCPQDEVLKRCRYGQNFGCAGLDLRLLDKIMPPGVAAGTIA
jgi:hypothetical protein